MGSGGGWGLDGGGGVGWSGVRWGVVGAMISYIFKVLPFISAMFRAGL